MTALFIIPLEGTPVLIGEVSATLMAQLDRTKQTDITNDEVPGVASILTNPDIAGANDEPFGNTARGIIHAVMGIDPGAIDELRGDVYVQVTRDITAKAGQPGVSALEGRLTGDGWFGPYFPTDASDEFGVWVEQTHREAWLTAVPAAVDPTSTKNF